MQANFNRSVETFCAQEFIKPREFFARLKHAGKWNRGFYFIYHNWLNPIVVKRFYERHPQVEPRIDNLVYLDKWYRNREQFESYEWSKCKKIAFEAFTYHDHIYRGAHMNVTQTDVSTTTLE